MSYYKYFVFIANKLCQDILSSCLESCYLGERAKNIKFIFRKFFVNFELLKKSSQIKAIKVHYFVPSRNKILNKFFLSISASVYFGKGPKL